MLQFKGKTLSVKLNIYIHQHKLMMSTFEDKRGVFPIHRVKKKRGGGEWHRDLIRTYFLFVFNGNNSYTHIF